MQAAVYGAVAGPALAPVLRGAVERYAVPEEQPWAVCCPGVPLRLPNGRCRRCRARGGPWPGSVEAVAASVGALVGWQVHGSALPVLAWFAAFAVVLAFVDGSVQRLPDRLTLPLLLGTAVLLPVADNRPEVLLRCLLAAGVFGLFFFVMALFAPIGLGDAKLAPTLGAILGLYGWQTVVAGFAYSWFTAALWVLALAAVGRIRRGIELALGPFLLLGTLLAVLAT